MDDPRLNDLETSAFGKQFTGSGSSTSFDRAVQVSIAISLKRIADALTGDGANLFTAPINSYGEGIGDAIQGQLVRGQAGISQYEGR